MFLFVAMVGESACRADTRPVRAARGGAENQELLLTELRALPIRADPHDRAAESLGRRFETLYRLRPAAAEGAPAIVRQERAPRGKIVLDALARANTAQSAAALAAIVTDEGAPIGARRYALERLRTWGPVLALSQ
jgi:hypothetical protein